MEEVLQASAAELAEAQRVARIGSWSFDLAKQQVSWSDELYRIFEMRPTDFAGRYDAFVSRIHPDDRARVLEVNAQTRSEGSPFDIEYRIVVDDRIKVIREIGYATRDEAGTVGRLFGTAQDITEQKQAESELSRKTEILQRIFDHIPVMINFIDADGRVQLVNREWERTLGWTLEEIRQNNIDVFAECYPDPQCRQEVLKFVNEAHGEWADFKTRVRDGRVIDTAWVRVRLSDGTKIGIGQDITERKRTEEKLQLVIDTIPIQVASTLPDGALDLVNARWREYFGLSLEEARQGGLNEVIHPEDRTGYLEHWRANVATGKPFEREARLRRADGEYRWLLSRSVPLRDEVGNIVRWYGTGIDIEDRKLAEDRLKATTDQLRALSAALETAREEEATRIARELHDELGSSLTSLRWDLERISGVCAEPADQADLLKLRETTRDMITLMDATINTVRRISSDLRPSVLDDLGLLPAIQWQVQQFKARSGIGCELHTVVEQVDLSRERATAVFRILQEAMTNILRHAHATRVDITITREATDLVVEIRDNGRGITESESNASNSIGLVGMRERAHLLRGTIAVRGCAQKGTVVTLRIPFPG